MAAASVANIVKSSLGPVGLDKMLVDDIGDVTISNDGATILRLLQVEHPAARVLVQLAELQDEEVGDGTTSVVIIAAELLKRANELVKQKLHPTSIMAGFRLASREATSYIKDHLVRIASADDRELLMSVARTSMSSKIIQGDGDLFASLCVDAVLRVVREQEGGGKRKKKKGSDKPAPKKLSVDVASINVLKASGKASSESRLVEGYALNCTIMSQQMPKRVDKARIALLDFNLQKARMDLGVAVVVSAPEKLEEIRQREEDIIKERIQLILRAGANVVLTTKGLDDMCGKYLVEAGVMGVRRVKSSDMRRIAAATGGAFISSLADLEGGEAFTADLLGTAECVEQVRVGDNELIEVRGCGKRGAASIMLRGANSMMLDEMERSVHDVLCVLKRVLESGRVVPGGGAVEAALSVHLEQFARSLESREQPAIAEFAQALLVIPKVLAVNAGKDATELVAQLRTAHGKGNGMMGLDLLSGDVRDNFAAGVLEPALGKVKQIRFATEAALQILRVDDVITMNERPKPDQDGHGH